MSISLKTSENTIVIGRSSPSAYVLDIIVRFNQGIDKVTIVGKGNNIPKAITVYNILKSRLGDALVLENVNIGSIFNERNRRISYIEIHVSRKI